MPRYEFRNTITGEIFEKTMKISEKETYLELNPDVESWFSSAPSVGDPVRLGVRRIDNGFKEVLQKVAEKTPGGQALKNNSTQNI